MKYGDFIHGAKTVYIEDEKPFKLRDGLLVEIGKYISLGYSAQHIEGIICETYKKTSRHFVRRFTKALIKKRGIDFKCPCGMSASHKSTCQFREKFEYYSKHSDWMNSKRMKPKKCLFCQKEYTPKLTSKQKFCSKSCNSKNNHSTGKIIRNKKTHCNRGHELKDPNLYYSNKRGAICRECAIYRAKKRQALLSPKEGA